MISGESLCRVVSARTLERLERLDRERQERERQEQLEREQLEWERERRISNAGKKFTDCSVFLMSELGGVWWSHKLGRIFSI